MKVDRFERLLTFLHRLAEAKIHFSLSYYRDDAISVQVVVPGERWEVDFLDDGTVDVERFVSHGDVEDEGILEELFANAASESSDKKAVHNDAITRK